LNFSDIKAELSEFRDSEELKDAEAEAEDSDARGRIAALKGKANQYSHIIAMLRRCDAAERSHSALHRF
jgi:hypothetical protein